MKLFSRIVPAQHIARTQRMPLLLLGTGGGGGRRGEASQVPLRGLGSWGEAAGPEGSDGSSPVGTVDGHPEGAASGCFAMQVGGALCISGLSQVMGTEGWLRRGVDGWARRGRADPPGSSPEAEQRGCPPFAASSLTCCPDIVDIKPANMEDLTEVITASEFHPHHCNLFVYSSSKGSLRLCDMRAAALCDKHSKRERSRSQGPRRRRGWEPRGGWAWPGRCLDWLRVGVG